jgi:hypothetical protein
VTVTCGTKKINWTDRARNEEAGPLNRVKEERNILQIIKRRKTHWIGHILRRNCLLKHDIEGRTEGRIEVKGRRGKRRKQILDDFKKTRGYWILKAEAIDGTVWRTRFGKGYGPVVRQTRMNDDARPPGCLSTSTKSALIGRIFVLLTATFVAHQRKGSASLHLHGNNVYANASRCYVMRTLTIFLI